MPHDRVSAYSLDILPLTTDFTDDKLKYKEKVNGEKVKVKRTFSWILSRGDAEIAETQRVQRFSIVSLYVLWRSWHLGEKKTEKSEKSVLISG